MYCIITFLSGLFQNEFAWHLSYTDYMTLATTQAGIESSSYSDVPEEIYEIIIHFLVKKFISDYRLFRVYYTYKK